MIENTRKLPERREPARITHSFRSAREGFLEEEASKLCKETDEFEEGRVSDTGRGNRGCKGPGGREHRADFWGELEKVNWIGA